VRDQVVLQREALLALETLVGPVARVQQEMRVETMFVGEGLAAVAAHVGPDPGVRPGVRRQMMLQQERLTALVAKVGTRLLVPFDLDLALLLRRVLAGKVHRIEREKVFRVAVAALLREELLFGDVVEEEHRLSEELALRTVGQKVGRGVVLDGVVRDVGLDGGPVRESGQIGGRTHSRHSAASMLTYKLGRRGAPPRLDKRSGRAVGGRGARTEPDKARFGRHNNNNATSLTGAVTLLSFLFYWTSSAPRRSIAATFKTRQRAHPCIESCITRQTFHPQSTNTPFAVTSLVPRLICTDKPYKNTPLSCFYRLGLRSAPPVAPTPRLLRLSALPIRILG
jgi:hypothetical protein